MQDDPGRYGRCAAADGRAYTRPCKTLQRRRFTFVYPKLAIFVPDTGKCPSPWLIYLRVTNKNPLYFKGKRLT